MDHVFVCYVDPDSFVKDSAYTFLQEDVEDMYSKKLPLV